MSDLGKKVGYLKGLMEGMDLSGDPSREKVFNAMADLMTEFADRVESMEEMLDDLNDYVESIDDDLAMLEGDREGGARFADEDDDDDFLDYLSEGEDQLHLLGGKAEESNEDVQNLAGAVCPECQKIFFVDADDPEDAVYTCPHCQKHIVPLPLTPDNVPIAKPE